MYSSKISINFTLIGEESRSNGAERRSIKYLSKSLKLYLLKIVKSTESDFPPLKLAAVLNLQ